MVELLIAVAAHQYLSLARPAQADAVWLAGREAAVQPTQSGCTKCPADR